MYEPVNRISNFVLMKHKAKIRRTQEMYDIPSRIHNQYVNRGLVDQRVIYALAPTPSLT